MGSRDNGQDPSPRPAGIDSPRRQLPVEDLWRVGAVVAERYLLQERIARGGTADVYRAEHVFTGAKLAIKLLHAHLAGRKGFAKRWHKEATVTARLDHPNHVRIHDAALIDGRGYIAMELLEGRDCRRMLVEDGPVEIERALYIVSEVADGVIKAHEIGVIHRDLKPENVFVTFSNSVKVLDFGIAKIRDFGPTMTGEGGILGTLPYMSPEQRRGERVDVRTDVYALGLILLELILGRHPLAIGPDEWPPEPMLRRMLENCVIERPSGPGPFIPESTWQIIDTALQTNPDDRFQTMTAFKDVVDAEMRTAAVGRLAPRIGSVSTDDSGVIRAIASGDANAGAEDRWGVDDRWDARPPKRLPEPDTAPEVPARRRQVMASVAAPLLEPKAESDPRREGERHLPASKFLLFAAIAAGAVVGSASILWQHVSAAPHMTLPKAVASLQEPVSTTLPQVNAAPPVEPTALMDADLALPAPAAPSAASSSAPIAAPASVPSKAPAQVQSRAPAGRNRIKVPSELIVPDFIDSAELAPGKPKPTPRPRNDGTPF